jgi:hypothetical protein
MSTTMTTTSLAKRCRHRHHRHCGPRRQRWLPRPGDAVSLLALLLLQMPLHPPRVRLQLRLREARQLRRR